MTRNKIDKDIIETYAKSLAKSAENINKFINYIELQSMIRRFLQLNPDADPKAIDWVGVWDERLTYTEQLMNFKEHYPMYKWQDELVVTEEAFESAKKAKLKRIIEELDEGSLRELAQLIEKELGGLPQAQTEQKKEPAIPSAQQPVTEPKEPKITLRTLAGVPVLLEARAFASAFEVSELLENNSLIEKAKKRVMTAIRGFPWPFGDPLEDVLTFGLGMLIVSQIRDRRVWERWAEAERRRIEAFLNMSDDDGILEVAWKDLIRAERCTEEEKRAGLPFKIHVTDYFRLAKGIGTERRPINRVWRGWVYITRGELVRLISEEAKLRILRRLETAPRVQIKMVQKIVEDIKQTLTLT